MLSRFNYDEKKENGNSTEKQYVVFMVGNEEFGVNIKQTKEIISATNLTFIPNAPDFVNGVINLRGEIVPVVDLHKRLSLQKKEEQEVEEKIIIVELDSNLIGMKVKDVKEIIRLNENDIGKAPEITQGINRKYVSGVGKLDERLLILLDLNRILSRQEIEEIDEMELD